MPCNYSLIYKIIDDFVILIIVQLKEKCNLLWICVITIPCHHHHHHHNLHPYTPTHLLLYPLSIHPLHFPPLSPLHLILIHLFQKWQPYLFSTRPFLAFLILVGAFLLAFLAGLLLLAKSKKKCSDKLFPKWWDSSFFKEIFCYCSFYPIFFLSLSYVLFLPCIVFNLFSLNGIYLCSSFNLAFIMVLLALICFPQVVAFLLALLTFSIL